jgi:hypothetical protein
VAGFQWKPYKNYHRGMAYVEEWHRLSVEALRELIVSDERRDWILARYPPDEVGRPGMFAGDQRTASKVKRRAVDLPEPKPAAEEIEEFARSAAA